MRKSLPNFLTFFRIILIPVVVAAFYIDGVLSHWLAAGLFGLASITDYFDGALARAWSTESNLGRFLDPIADKLLVSAVILMLVHEGRADVIPAILIVCREILVSGLREFLAEVNVRVAVSSLAKLKTGVQMGALFALLLGSKGTGIDFIDEWANYALWLAALLTLITGYAYLKAGLKHMAKS